MNTMVAFHAPLARFSPVFTRGLARVRVLAPALLLALFLLSACAEKTLPPPAPQGPPQPVPLAAADPRHPVLYYATNRNVLADGASGGSARYGGGRSKETSYGEIRASISGDPGSADKIEDRISLDRVTKATSTRTLAELERAAARTPGREVTLFIHGFNNGFEDAARAAVRLGYGMGVQGAMALYSWPSAGSTTAYLYDRNNAYWAVHYLKDVLRSLTDSTFVGRVNIVVHSMGNEVFIRAFSELTDECAQKASGCMNLRKVRAIVLAAPDMDREIFLDQYASKLSGLGARVALYASRSDMALAASAVLQGGDYDRLGKNVLCLPGIQVTDVTDVKTDMLGHSWILDSRAVMNDLRCMLREGCDRFTDAHLKEVLCSPGEKYYLPPTGRAEKSTSGDYYWRLTVPDSGGFKLDPSALKIDPSALKIDPNALKIDTGNFRLDTPSTWFKERQ